MLKLKSIDPVNGRLLPSIILYCLPLMLGSFIQVLFNAADMAVLGNVCRGDNGVAVASVGATSPVVGLIVNVAIGLSGGTNVILARAIGAGDKDRTHKVVDTSMIIALALGVITLAVGLLVSPALLRVTNCPEECFAGADTYLKIYFSAMPFVMIYNFGSAVIRVEGDSNRPLIYMAVSGGVNILLNLILCMILPNKVAAVAIATLVSQGIGAVMVLYRLFTMSGPCRVRPRQLVFDMRSFVSVMRMGIPCAINSSLYNIANLQIQSAMNSFGPAAIAGNSSATQAEMVTGSVASSFSTASLAFVGQNIGAGNKQRVRSSIFWCCFLSFATAQVIGLGIFAFGRQFLAIFLPGDTLAIEYGMMRMLCVLAIYGIGTLNSTISSIVQAFGNTAMPMYTGLVTVLGFRLLWMNFIYPYLPFSGDGPRDIFFLFVCFSISWILSLAANSVTFSVMYSRYKRGKVKEL